MVFFSLSRDRVAVTSSGERRTLSPSDERELAKIEQAKRDLELMEQQKRAAAAPPIVAPPTPTDERSATSPTGSTVSHSARSGKDKKEKKSKV